MLQQPTASGSSGHVDLRTEVKRRGFKNSFPGATTAALQAIIDLDDSGLPVPSAAQTKEGFAARQSSAYHELIDGCTLDGLARAFPSDDSANTFSIP